MKLAIICSGIGGRGVLLASTIVMETAIRAGYHAMASDEYGMSQRGGSVVSAIKIGDCKSPLIGRESADILLAFEESEFYRTVSFLKTGGMTIVNTGQSRLSDPIARLLEARGVQSHLVDADSIAERHHMVQAANMAVLGYFSAVSKEVFTFQNIEGTIKEKVSAKFLTENLAVFQEGFEAAAGGGGMK